MQLAHIDFLDEQLDTLSAEITGLLTELSAAPPTPPPAAAAGGAREGDRASAPAPADTPMTFARAVTVLDTIPGVNQRGGELLVAEWGIDMARFGTAERLSAWSGVAPGNDESAGKQRSGKTRKGNRALRTGLTPVGPCGGPHQGHLSVGLVSPPGGAPGEETRHHGGRPLDRGECLPYALPERTVSGVGGQLL